MDIFLEDKIGTTCICGQPKKKWLSTCMLCSNHTHPRLRPGLRKEVDEGYRKAYMAFIRDAIAYGHLSADSKEVRAFIKRLKYQLQSHRECNIGACCPENCWCWEAENLIEKAFR